MTESYLGEIRMFAGTFAPTHWAFCDGQLIAITSNNALYSLLGTYYGGDGRSTFGLPEMRGRTPIGAGTGAGLSPRPLGQKAGQPQVALTSAEMPAHNHSLIVSSSAANSNTFNSSYLIGKQRIFADKPGSTLQDHLADQAIGDEGANTPHDNYMPSIVLSFITCVAGLYPSRN